MVQAEVRAEPMSLIDRAIQNAFRRIRLGFYHATVSGSPDEYQRQDVDAEWGPTLKRVRRIASPILDVVAPLGARMAVLSQDGVPEYAATIGQVWDDLGTPKAMTAWLRANLLKHPGHVELGATKGVRIRVGANTVTVTPLADGTLELDATNIKLGGTAVSALLKAPEFLAFFDAHFHNDPISGVTGPPTVLATPLAATLQTTKTKGE